MLFVCFKDIGIGCRVQGEWKTQIYRKSQQCREAGVGTKGQTGTYCRQSAETGRVQVTDSLTPRSDSVWRTGENTNGEGNMGEGD